MHNISEDYYKLLGLQRNATSEEIRKAYKELAKKYHPDAYAMGTPEKAQAEEQFAKITAAYKVLSNEKDRKNYDELIALRASTKSTPPNQDQKMEWDKIHFERGKKELESGHLEKAIESFREASRLRPNIAAYHSYLGIAYLRKGWKGYAKGEFLLALQLDPKDPSALKYRQETEEPSKEKGILKRIFKKK